MSSDIQELAGYSYGGAGVGRSSVSVKDLTPLKVRAGFSEEDDNYLRMAGAVLEDQTEAIVHHWRNGIIAGIPHLARHSRTLDGEPIPEYLEKSNARFGQWILDTCLRSVFAVSKFRPAIFRVLGLATAMYSLWIGVVLMTT